MQMANQDAKENSNPFAISTDVSGSNCVKLIETELAWISENTKKPGWSSWAIALAAAAILWKLVEIIGQNSGIPQYSYDILLAVWLAGIGITTLGMLIDLPFMRDSDPRYTNKSHSETNRPTQCAIALASSVGLLAILIINPDNSEIAKPKTAWVVIAAAISTHLLALLHSYSKDDFALLTISGNKSLFRVTSIALAAITILSTHSAAYQTTQLSSKSTLIETDSVKCALLIYGLILTSRLWKPWHKRSKVEINLHKIRQSLLLGESPSQHLNSIKMLTTGLSSVEFLQLHGQELESVSESIAKKVKYARSDIQKIEKALVDDNLDDAALELRFNAAYANHTRICELIDELKNYTDLYPKYSSIVKRMARSGTDTDFIKTQLGNYGKKTKKLAGDIASVLDENNDLLELIKKRSDLLYDEAD